MSRAERRRKQRARQKAEKRNQQVGPNNGHIKLENPVQDHFPAFIVGNWLRMMAGDLPPEIASNPARYFEALTDLANHQEGWHVCSDVVEEGEGVGKHLLICGAGPSLAENIQEWRPRADHVWGCNSAVAWLHNEGWDPTHGFTIDQTPAMLNEWQHVLPVEYLVASTVHPHLVEHLLAHGRRPRFFNNYVGIKRPPVTWRDGSGETWSMPFEDWLYCMCFAPTVRAGSGLNSVVRAIDVATFMGYDKISVLGADCALKIKRRAPTDAPLGSDEHKRWLEQDVTMHVGGGHALTSGATGVTLGGEIDGRWWESKPDLLVSAVFLVKMKQTMGDRLELVGDTLPNALADKPDTFLRRLPNLVNDDGEILIPEFG